jgi:Spy/CpxP family protein refolding chaperone
MRLARVLWCLVLGFAAAGAPVFAQGKSPEEMAKWIAARWKPILELSDEQTARFEAVALEDEKRTAAARVAAGGDWAKFRELMRPILADRSAAVAKILTPEQLRKYESALAEARKKAAEKPAGPSRGKPPG